MIATLDVSCFMFPVTQVARGVLFVAAVVPCVKVVTRVFAPPVCCVQLTLLEDENFQKKSVNHPLRPAGVHRIFEEQVPATDRNARSHPAKIAAARTRVSQWARRTKCFGTDDHCHRFRSSTAILLRERNARLCSLGEGGL